MAYPATGLRTQRIAGACRYEAIINRMRIWLLVYASFIS